MFEDGDKYPKNFSVSTWKKMSPFAKPYGKNIILILITMLICAAVDISLPLFLRYAVSNFIEKGSTEGILPFSAAYFVSVVVLALSVYWMARNAMYVEMNFSRDLKRASFFHLQKLSFSYYNQNAVGWLLARVMSDTNRISGVIAWSITDLFWSIFYVAGTFAAMLAIHWRLALLVIAVAPPVALFIGVFQGKFLSAYRKERAANSRMVGAYNEGITGAKTSKTLVIEDKNNEDFQQITGDLYRAALRATRMNALFVPIITFFSSVAVAFVLVSGGGKVLDGSLDYATLFAFISYAVTILEPIQNIARVFAEFISTQANIERVTGLLETQPEITDTPEVVEKYGTAFEPKPENWEKIQGEIEFRDIWFRYPDSDEWVLQDFNLKIPAGTNVAIVGETGAGKSTLVNLACRFFEPTRGSVLIDGIDYKQRSQLWLHSQLGYVLQSPHLFSGSVRENIRYGRLNATDEEVYKASQLVSAHPMILRLENGYDTDVGEGGDRLSAGEKQLISFARAVLANPPIFVLDEATSSIDTETERWIQEAITHVLKGRTSFLVAHRLSTIRHSDLILLVEAGQIIERGTHRELLCQKGKYHSLYTAMQVEEAVSG